MWFLLAEQQGKSTKSTDGWTIEHSRVHSALKGNVQGDPKKTIHSVLQLKSVVEVGFNFSMGVSESEF